MGAEYKNFCLTKSLLVKSVLWIEINPTLHIVLTHSPELMEENDNTGILNFTVLQGSIASDKQRIPADLITNQIE